MTPRRQVITQRPEYTRPAYARGNSSPTPNNTTPSRAHAAQCTTTTNVVSVVHVAAHVSDAHTKQEEQLDNLLEQMTQLTPALQKQLLDRVAARQLLDQSSKRADRDIAMWAAAAYDAFCSAIGGPGAAGVGPVIARRLLGVASAWQPVEQFMAAAKLQELPVVDRQAVYYMLADLLVEQTRSIARYTGAPFSVKLMSTVVVNIAGLFDSAFPGYLEAGLARVVARRHQLLKTQIK